jgi:RNA polymerase sigma-70 factor (ECF subfamily)
MEERSNAESTVGRGDDPLAPLVAGALERDPKSLRRLLDAVGPDVARVVGLVVGHDASDLDDICQEALLGVVRALPDFRGECAVRRFARRVAVRTALSQRRRAARKATHHERWVDREAGAPPEVTVDPVERPGRELLRALLVELPEAQAEALVLRVVLGCSIREIAEATGAPANTVRSRLRLAKEALRRRITSDSTLRESLPAPREGWPAVDSEHSDSEDSASEHSDSEDSDEVST